MSEWSFTWRVIAYAIGLVLLSGVIGAGVWAFRVITAPAKGAGDQEIIINDGHNRINAQEWFESQYGQIKAADAKLDDAKANWDANPKDDFWRTNFTGLRNRCLDMVETYNAEARKVSREDWRSRALPGHIDVNGGDPATDCKEKVR